MENDLSTLGKRLLFLRQTANKTLQEISDHCKISRSNLGKYEKDTVQPTAESIISICNYYEISTDWLLKGSDVDNHTQRQNIILSFDHDISDMLAAVKTMMSDPDPDIRAWAKIQFRKTFAEYMPPKEQKK